MPLINVKVIEDVFTPEQKREIVGRLTDAMVAVEGEVMRPVTWVTSRRCERRLGHRRQAADHRRRQGTRSRGACLVPAAEPGRGVALRSPRPVAMSLGTHAVAGIVVGEAADRARRRSRRRASATSGATTALQPQPEQRSVTLAVVGAGQQREVEGIRGIPQVVMRPASASAMTSANISSIARAGRTSTPRLAPRRGPALAKEWATPGSTRTTSPGPATIGK